MTLETDGMPYLEAKRCVPFRCLNRFRGVSVPNHNKANQFSDFLTEVTILLNTLKNYHHVLFEYVFTTDTRTEQKQILFLPLSLFYLAEQ